MKGITVITETCRYPDGWTFRVSCDDKLVMTHEGRWVTEEHAAAALVKYVTAVKRGLDSKDITYGESSQNLPGWE